MYDDLETLEMEALDDFELDDLEAYDDFEFDDYEDDDYEFDDLEAFDEFEDGEADPFLGSVFRSTARRVRRRAKHFGIPTSPRMLKSLARRAAQVAGGAIGGPTGANIANLVASRVIRESEFEGEYEYDSEADLEAEFEAIGGDWETLDDMEYYAAMAAEAESEEDADFFLGALAGAITPLMSSVMPMVQQALPVIAEGVSAAAPHLIQAGTSALGSFLKRPDDGRPGAGAAPTARRRGYPYRPVGRRPRRRRRRMPRYAAYEASPRQAIKAVPTIVAKTATLVSKQAQAGRPITPKKVAAIMAQQTAKTLCHPHKYARALKKNTAAARRVARRKRALTRGRVGRSI